MLKASMESQQRDISLPGEKIKARALIKDALRIQERHMHIPVLFLPFGRAQAAFKSRSSQSDNTFSRA